MILLHWYVIWAYLIRCIPVYVHKLACLLIGVAVDLHVLGSQHVCSWGDMVVL